ncbi:39S ribosomal protein L2, mitochondrial [Cimex lectularius]|uniref:39S ribosomal protein L2, mitochondrial n=1 Tax=Cimex lectularius TaxID=79782 RepID=A0A8I6RA69_CIMLE|nr:39S ribosomal protein L2, mitochondrial [Cimex lectularius]
MSLLFSFARGSLLRGCLLQVQAATISPPFRQKTKEVDLPSNVGPRAGRFRRNVQYPDEYTIEPLNVTNLGGRDPVSGRLVVKGIGGGIKRKYHWIDWKRVGPKDDGPPLVEKVVEIMIDYCRTARIALIAGGKKTRYILATENMKPGDLIKTSQFIPRIPVFANEGDAYPLGALQLGTIVHNIEMHPGRGGFYVHSAGSFATILRKVDKRVVIRLPSKLEVSLKEECMATVGRLSNVDHQKTPIGSAQKNRELGNRPRSGLWQRKDGRFGRKIRAPPPLFVVPEYGKEENNQHEVVELTLNNDMYYNSKLWGHSKI